jgi:hypothetical protein
MPNLADLSVEALQHLIDSRMYGEAACERMRSLIHAKVRPTVMPAAPARPPVPPRRREAAFVRPAALGAVTFTLYGPPRTKKTSNRLVVHEGRRKVLPSKAWCDWVAAARREFGAAVPRLPPDRYNCAAIFYRDADRGDRVGYEQGLYDLLEKLGVVSNDVQLVQGDGTRLAVDRACPRVVVTLTRLTADG